MIKTEEKGNLIRHYSDEGLKLKQIETDAVYDEAWDVIPCRFTYAETDEHISDDPTAEEIVSILIGETE